MTGTLDRETGVLPVLAQRADDNWGPLRREGEVPGRQRRGSGERESRAVSDVQRLCDDSAADGREALDQASRQIFDMVLMDIKMPRMSGLEALDKFHADYPFTLVIMITAMASWTPPWRRSGGEPTTTS